MGDLSAKAYTRGPICAYVQRPCIWKNYLLWPPIICSGSHPQAMLPVHLHPLAPCDKKNRVRQNIFTDFCGHEFYLLVLSQSQLSSLLCNKILVSKV